MHEDLILEVELWYQLWCHTADGAAPHMVWHHLRCGVVFGGIAELQCVVDAPTPVWWHCPVGAGEDPALPGNCS